MLPGPFMHSETFLDRLPGPFWHSETILDRYSGFSIIAFNTGFPGIPGFQGFPEIVWGDDHGWTLLACSRVDVLLN